MLQEISRRTIHLAKYEDSDIVWNNNVLTVRCDTGLHLFNFSYNLNCLDKTINLYESRIYPSRSSPATELFPISVVNLINAADHNEMILDPALWPHNARLMEAAIIIAFEWSPVDFRHNNECVLATLNSAGNIDIYAHERRKWPQTENLSTKLTHEMKMNFLIPSVSCIESIEFTELKEAAYALEPSAICWSPLLNVDNSCYFVTAQKNGRVIFWLLKYVNIGIDVKLQGYISDNTERIVAMKWIPTYNNKFKLICSNVLGEIFAYDCEIENNIFKHFSTNNLWFVKDKTITLYIYYEFINDRIFLAYNKHKHLILQLLDENCNLLSQFLSNVNDQRITALTKTKNGLYVSTVNREIYLVRYSINEDIDVQLVPVDMKSIPSMLELHSFDYSANNTLLALALLDRTLLCTLHPFKLHITLYAETGHDTELASIIDNPTKTLTHMWDTIELLRYKTLKLQLLPTYDYNKLYGQAKTNMYYAKVFLILLNFYNNLEKTNQNNSKGVLPKTTVEEVETFILARHAAELMKKLYVLFCNDNKGNKLKYESYVIAGVYVDEYCQKSNMNINEVLTPDMVDMFHKKKNYFKRTCQYCDELLEGFQCIDGHVNLLCSLSFTIIDIDQYLVCRCCGFIVRCELLSEKPKCIFCDIYVCYCYLPS